MSYYPEMWNGIGDEPPDPYHEPDPDVYMPRRQHKHVECTESMLRAAIDGTMAYDEHYYTGQIQPGAMFKKQAE